MPYYRKVNRIIAYSDANSSGNKQADLPQRSDWARVPFGSFKKPTTTVLLSATTGRSTLYTS